jgi:hypothetical protein
MRAEIALVIVSQVFLAVAFVFLLAYVHDRCPDESPQLADYVVLSLGLFPTSFYFRMAYTESMLLCLSILAFYGMRRQWPLLVIAVIIGLATGTRSVGVALLAPFLIEVQRRSENPVDCCLKCVFLLPLACWGLATYIAFQAFAFDEPFAFIKTQVHWSRQPIESGWQLAEALFSYEPIRSVYDPTSNCYWGRFPPKNDPLLNLMFANPIYFTGAVALLMIGILKNWLTRQEWLLTAGLLLIPYLTQAYRTGMASQARFSAVAFPLYLVLGHILVRLPPAIVICLASIGTVFLTCYTTMFVNWYWYY